MLAHLPVQRPPLVFSNLGHRTAKLHGHVNPYRKHSITPNRSSLPSAQYRSNSC